MTQGGPVGSTRTVVYDLIEEFNRLNLGTASAIAYILLIILATLSWIQMHFFGSAPDGRPRRLRRAALYLALIGWRSSWSRPSTGRSSPPSSSRATSSRRTSCRTR